MLALKVHINDLHVKHRPFRAVSEFAQGYSGGVNIGYFQRASSHPTGSAAEGAVIADGQLLCNALVAGRPALIYVPLDPPGIRLRIDTVWGLPKPEHHHLYKVYIQAGPWLVRNGDMVTAYGNYPGVNPTGITQRVGIGILGEYVIIAVGDSTLPNMAAFLHGLGCRHAIAGDGGSSASLYLDGQKVYGSTQMVPNALVWTKYERLKTTTEKSSGVNFQLTPNFRLSEFACKCCNRVMLGPKFEVLVGKLQTLRDNIGRPITITSGYRCPDHNKAVGGVANSQHLYGAAADIVCGLPLDQFAVEVQKIGFSYVQPYPSMNFIHVDMRG